MKKLIPLVLISLKLQNLIFADDSIGVKRFMWANNQIKTCWLDNGIIAQEKFNHYQQAQLRNLNYQSQELDEKDKLALQKLANEQFSDVRTGIHFVGWQNCGSDLSDVQLMIITGENKSDDTLDHDTESREVRLGKATIGQGYIAINEPLVSDEQALKQRMGFLFLNTNPPSASKISKLQSLSYTFLHELGHVAGLLHEHSRDEAKNDKICQQSGLTLSENNDEALYDTFSTYDSSSIMNYCFLNFVRTYGLSIKVVKKKSFWEKLSKTLLDSDVAGLDDSTSVIRQKVDSNEQRLNINIGLSQKDVKALKCFYSNRSGEIADSCQ